MASVAKTPKTTGAVLAPIRPNRQMRIAAFGTSMRNHLDKIERCAELGRKDRLEGSLRFPKLSN
jgi:hypothetical protein